MSNKIVLSPRNVLVFLLEQISTWCSFFFGTSEGESLFWVFFFACSSLMSFGCSQQSITSMYLIYSPEQGEQSKTHIKKWPVNLKCWSCIFITFLFFHSSHFSCFSHQNGPFFDPKSVCLFWMRVMKKAQPSKLKECKGVKILSHLEFNKNQPKLHASFTLDWIHRKSKVLVKV